jgi:hypothetical protein
MLLKNSMMFEVFLSIYKFRVEREYPNPNPKLRVPAISGNKISGLTSGNSFNYPNFSLPELPDPIGSGNPNAQSEWGGGWRWSVGVRRGGEEAADRGGWRPVGA